MCVVPHSFTSPSRKPDSVTARTGQPVRHSPPLSGADVHIAVTRKAGHFETDRSPQRTILSRTLRLDHVAVVGAGFIGLEMAAFLRETGKAVNVVEMADRVMARVVSEPVSDWFLALHRE